MLQCHRCFSPLATGLLQRLQWEHMRTNIIRNRIWEPWCLGNHVCHFLLICSEEASKAVSDEHAEGAAVKSKYSARFKRRRKGKKVYKLLAFYLSLYFSLQLFTSELVGPGEAVQSSVSPEAWCVCQDSMRPTNSYASIRFPFYRHQSHQAICQVDYC